MTGSSALVTLLLAALAAAPLACAREEAADNGRIVNEGETPGAPPSVEIPAERVDEPDDATVGQREASDEPAAEETAATASEPEAPARRYETPPERAARYHRDAWRAHRRAAKRAFGY